MAGRRLLDAARLFNAGRSIASQHIAIRKDQWSLFTKTSSLAKAAKRQTDRVTVTAGAAVELAKRFNETGPRWQDEAQAGADTARRRAEETISQVKDEAQNVARDVEIQARSAGYDNLANAAAQARGQDADDGTLASLRKQEQQKVAERSLPQKVATDDPKRDLGAGQDTFSERPTAALGTASTTTELHVPAEDISGQADSLKENQLNQDVFPEPHDLPPEGVNLDAFHSPKVSQMLGRSRPKFENPYGSRQRAPPRPLPEMLAAEQARKSIPESVSRSEETVKAAAANPATPELQKTAQSKPQETSQPGGNGYQSLQDNRKVLERLQAQDEGRLRVARQGQDDIAQNSGAPTNGDRETEDLAASIAKDAEIATHAESQTQPYEMHESRVPATRFGRIWQYGGLATSMAFGAVGEGFRRMTGSGASGSLMLSEGNMNRLVAKLSRMRGAALKLGQMMSFQDSKVLPATINTILQRVQDNADYMPASQRDKVLVRNLGQDWRDLFTRFEEKPFAAASIGQVHKAQLKSNGEDVAVKIQYPGVRNSIDSDLNNLSLLLTASQLLPKGLFLDKTIANARTELGWECDYEREAKACIRFKEELLIDEPDTFSVPKIFTEASGVDVLTAEFMHGTAVTKIKDLSQNERDWIGTQILRLCLRELMEWRFMQTDPNWTNFLYNRKVKKLELLDFGASREFPIDFVEPYVELLIAASKNDREACRDYSIQLGYLTGNESKEMLKAHVDSILTLAEPFLEGAPEVYDFQGQTITDRVRANIGLMLRERQAPPPEETYSLHRKLSGAFLLCARLQSNVPAREMFAKAVEVWRGREQAVKI